LLDTLFLSTLIASIIGQLAGHCAIILKRDRPGCRYWLAASAELSYALTYCISFIAITKAAAEYCTLAISATELMPADEGHMRPGTQPAGRAAIDGPLYAIYAAYDTLILAG